MTAVVLVRQVDCAAGVSAIWRVVSDTERINQAMGLGSLTVTPSEGAGPARFRVKTRLAGFAVEWDEYPPEFVENEQVAVHRVMRRGPLEALRIVISVSPREGGGSRVHLELILEPRTRVLVPIARLAGGHFLTRFAEIVHKVDVEMASSGVEPWRNTRVREAFHTVASPLVVERTKAALRELLQERERAALEPIARRLVDFVVSAPDLDVARIRPFELADEWGVDRRAVATVCLTGVVAGLLELTWDLVCPSCQLAARRFASLADLNDSGHCQMCDLGFGVDFDRAIEATFRPALSLRPVDDKPYCMSAVARMPHVVAQAVLPAGGEAAIKVPDAAGRYRLFVRGGDFASVEVAADAAAEARATAGERLEPRQLEVAPGGRITIGHPFGEPRHVKLERLAWASRAATAHFISTLPSFRRLFAGDVLRAGVVLKVARVAFIFSDLMGSTALYSRAGDAVAFRIVIDHFELLQKVAEEHAGTIIKTIGDAIMAVFLEEEHAVRAAVAMQVAYDGFRRAHGAAAETHLKLGAYAGPCYAVTANKVIDYFGQCVNIASRLQALAGPAEIVLPEELAARADDAGWLAGARVSERFEVALKGIDAPMRAARLAIEPRAAVRAHA